MKTFKNRICRLKTSGAEWCDLLFLTIGLIFLFFGFRELMRRPTPFDPMQSNNRATLAVRCLVGPYAERIDNHNRTKEAFYIAINADGGCSLVSTGAHPGTPVYGEDVNVNNLDDLDDFPVVTLHGFTSELPEEAVPYLLESLELDANEDYKEYFGDYCLDTRTENSCLTIFLICGTFPTLIGFLCFLPGLLSRKALRTQLTAMEQNGSLLWIYQDFMASQQEQKPLYSRKLQIAMSKHYLLDFHSDENITVLPLSEIVNAYRCHMIDGSYTPDIWLAVETRDGKRYCFARTEVKRNDFDMVLNRLRAIAGKGVQA